MRYLSNIFSSGRRMKLTRNPLIGKKLTLILTQLVSIVVSLTSWHPAGKQTHGETYDPLHTYPLSTNLFLFVAIKTLDLVVAYDKILCNPFYNPIPPFYCILSSILDLIQNSISIITCLSLSSYHTSTSTTLYLSISTPLSNSTCSM